MADARAWTRGSLRSNIGILLLQSHANLKLYQHHRVADDLQCEQSVGKEYLNRLDSDGRASPAGLSAPGLSFHYQDGKKGVSHQINANLRVQRW